jgi:hypothetical protein
MLDGNFRQVQLADSASSILAPSVETGAVICDRFHHQREKNLSRSPSVDQFF